MLDEKRPCFLITLYIAAPVVDNVQIDLFMMSVLESGHTQFSDIFVIPKKY